MSISRIHVGPGADLAQTPLQKLVLLTVIGLKITTRLAQTVSETARLDEGHRPSAEDEELAETNVEDEGSEQTDLDVSCQRCLGEAEGDDWESVEDGEWEEVTESEYCEVRCASCDHEVEFGYSHRDDSGREVGRIWPCESSDFNPWLTFPDRRFAEDWKRRGWLRPPK